MSSKSYEQRTRGLPYVHKINLGNNNRRTRKKPLKLCTECDETNECIKLISSRVNKIEEIVDNFHKNLPKREKNKPFYTYTARFILNNVPCELEYDLSNF